MERTPLHLTSLTSNKVDKDKREQQVARTESKALTNNSQQEDRSRPVSSKTWKDHLYFTDFDTLDQLVSLKLDIDCLKFLFFAAEPMLLLQTKLE